MSHGDRTRKESTPHKNSLFVFFEIIIITMSPKTKNIAVYLVPMAKPERIADITSHLLQFSLHIRKLNMAAKDKKIKKVTPISFDADHDLMMIVGVK
ncbi:MAG: hypothetical protein ABIH89_03520 [Elusimicrobiota bacterium]